MKNGKLALGMLAVLAVFIGGWFLVSGRSKAPQSASADVDILYYYCPMHTQIRQDHPGQCPICSMTLVPRRKSEDAGSSAKVERKVKYWVDSMNPKFHSDKPGKAPDGMDLVPVYEGVGGTPQAEVSEVLKDLAPIVLTPYKEQLIGLRLTEVLKKPVVRLIRTVGRFGGGAGDFASAASDFAASGTVGRRGPRFVVADVYALDRPFVRPGQKAWVSPFSGGSAVEGRVAQIYPYDETQSRITRVRIDLLASARAELFANIEIEAQTDPRLSVNPEAILDTGTVQYAFRSDGAGRYTPVRVTVGFKGDDRWEIVSGLKEGDKVVDGAPFLVDADSKLKAVFESMDAGGLK